MGRQFGRVATVVAGDVEIPCGGTDGLRVAFDVRKTIKLEPNVAEIRIYNLAEATRAKLQGAGVAVILSAGYQDESAVVFSGDSRTIDHVRDHSGVDWITRIRCGDGERAYRWARVGESFAPGTPLAEVIRHAARALGVGLGNLDAQLGSITGQASRGYVLHGPAARELDTLLRSVGLSYSIQDGALQVLAGGPATGGVVRLSPETGLVGSPEHEAPERKFVQVRPIMIRFRALLNPRLRVGGLVELASEGVNGQYLLKTLQHRGDTHGAEWHSIGEVWPHGSEWMGAGR